MFLLAGLAGGQLIFHRHHVEPVALALLPLQAAATDAQLLEQPTAQLLQFVFGPLINNDSIWTGTNNFLHGKFPGAEDALAQQRNPHRSHHQTGELTGFHVKTEAQHPPQLFAGFRNHLAVDHPAVAVGIEIFRQRIH